MKDIHFLLAHNTAQQLLSAGAVALLTLAVLLGIRRFVGARLRILSAHTVTIWDNVLADVLQSTRLSFILGLALASGLDQIELSPRLAALPGQAMIVLVILQVGFWTTRAVLSWSNLRVKASEAADDGATITNLGAISVIARLMIWILVILSLLDNLGVNITTLIASLGIGGVAVALALQNVLGDIFASLSIALDKPFVVGDFVVVDDMMGTVKHIGLKTTRIQSLSGEELVFSNADLLKSRIRNYKHMAERRVVFSLNITYDTPTASLKALVEQVKIIINAQPQTRFDRAHFKSFGTSSLEFEVVYYMLVPDFTASMDTQQTINLALLDYCDGQHIEFAFPTQTIQLARKERSKAKSEP